MTKHLAIFFSTVNVVFGQNLSVQGKYFSGNNYVNVTEKTVEFKTSYGCCLLIDYYGFGNYTLRNDSICVYTGTASLDSGSTYKVLADLNKSDQLALNIQVGGEPSPLCSVYIIDNKNSKYNKASGDMQGFAFIDSISLDSIENKTLMISNFGMDSYGIPLNLVVGKSILVNLSGYRKLENKLVAFKVESDSTETKLIGPYFPLTKEEKRVQKREMRKSTSINWRNVLPWNWFRKRVDIHGDPTQVFVRRKLAVTAPTRQPETDTGRLTR